MALSLGGQVEGRLGKLRFLCVASMEQNRIISDNLQRGGYQQRQGRGSFIEY